jgi:predicted GIY-YIG superfamily endonuclease
MGKSVPYEMCTCDVKHIQKNKKQCPAFTANKKAVALAKKKAREERRNAVRRQVTVKKTHLQELRDEFL